MSQLLKRIIVSQNPNILIEDLGVFIRNKGDSLDLLSNSKTKPKFALEQICNSRSLDNLIKLGHLKLYDESGNELSNASGQAEKSTNLATLKDIDDAVNEIVPSVDGDITYLRLDAGNQPLTGDVWGSDFVKTRNIEIIRSGSDVVQIQKTGGRTINITRVDGTVVSYTDGLYLWQIVRNLDGSVQRIQVSQV